jgi:hypothetical protein
VAEVMLQRSGADALVGQLIAGAMTEHVWVNTELKGGPQICRA